MKSLQLHIDPDVLLWILVGLGLSLLCLTSVYWKLDRRAGSGFWRRLWFRLGYIRWKAKDALFLAWQQTILNHYVSTLLTIIIGVWLFLEALHIPHNEDFREIVGRAVVASITTLMVYVHGLKLIMDIWSHMRMRASSTIKGTLNVIMADLSDHFLRKESQTYPIQANTISEKASDMLETMTFTPSHVQIITLKLVNDAASHRIKYDVVGMNAVARVQHDDSWFLQLAASLSSLPTNDPFQRHISHCVVKELNGKLDQTRFRTDCIVLENLKFEAAMGKAGRPIAELQEGSCIAFTLSLHDKSHGILILAISPVAGAFRKRDSHHYAVGLRACAMMALGLHDKTPKVLPKVWY